MTRGEIRIRSWRELLPEFALTAAVMLGYGCSSPTGGGGVVQTEFDILEVYDPVTNMWAELDSMPTPRSTAAAVEYDGKLWVIGGSDWKVRGQPRYKVVEVFDPVANTWTTKAPMSVTREAPGAGVIGGKIYVVGGGSSPAVLHNTMEIYDPVGDSWSAGPPMTTKRFGPAVGVIGGKLYVAGGLDENEVDVNTVEVFDPVAGNWAAVTPMPTGRGQAFAGVVNDTMYVIGGFTDLDSTTDVNERFVPPGSWNSLPANLPATAGEMDGGVLDGKIYIVGGITQEGTSITTLNALRVFDPAANTWMTLAVMPTARSEPSAAFVNGKLYVAGGYSGR